MVYSLKDIYSNTGSTQLPTIEQTIPEDAEEEKYIDTETTINTEGQMEAIPKKEIWLGIAGLVGVLILINFI